METKIIIKTTKMPTAIKQVVKFMMSGFVIPLPSGKIPSFIATLSGYLDFTPQWQRSHFRDWVFFWFFLGGGGGGEGEGAGVERERENNLPEQETLQSLIASSSDGAILQRSGQKFSCGHHCGL